MADKKLLDQLADKIRMKHYSRKTFGGRCAPPEYTGACIRRMGERKERCSSAR